MPLHKTRKAMPLHKTRNAMPLHVKRNAMPLHKTRNAMPLHKTRRAVHHTLLVTLVSMSDTEEPARLLHAEVTVADVPDPIDGVHTALHTRIGALIGASGRVTVGSRFVGLTYDNPAFKSMLMKLRPT
jgi:hypothetical protein